METMIVIGNIPYFPKVKEPKNLFSAEEIDQLDSEMLAELSHDELVALRQKLSDTFDWLESGDWDIGDPRWDEYGKRLDHVNDMMDSIDEILNPGKDWDEDEEEE